MWMWMGVGKVMGIRNMGGIWVPFMANRHSVACSSMFTVDQFLVFIFILRFVQS